MINFELPWLLVKKPKYINLGVYFFDTFRTSITVPEWSLPTNLVQ